MMAKMGVEGVENVKKGDFEERKGGYQDVAEIRGDLLSGAP
jgi:hypothetical protein